MTFHELQLPEEARAYLIQGLSMMRAASWQPEIVRPALNWVRQLASEGHPIPWPGFVSDLGVIVSGWETRFTMKASSNAPIGLSQSYEDYVLAKLYSDRGIERAADSLRRMPEKDRNRAIPFIVDSVRERLGIGGVLIAPAALRPLLEVAPRAGAARQFELSEALRRLLAEQLQELVDAFRTAPELLTPEDIFELERGTAVAELAQRLALRQVVRAATALDDQISKAPPIRPTLREAPTQLLDDDVYPVGGFAAISNRGSLESLLHSQLAYMEREQADRPDLFDIKYLRDELLYYSRDENQFYRRRRHMRFEFAADLVAARAKDRAAPFQRIVLMMAAIVVVVRRLVNWLSDEALTFELQFPGDGALDAERELLAILFRDEIADGLMAIASNTKQTTKIKGRDIRQAHEVRSVLVTTAGMAKNDQLTMRCAGRPTLDNDTSALKPGAETVNDWPNIVVELLHRLMI